MFFFATVPHRHEATWLSMPLRATTMAAFMPMLFIGDRIGDILRAIPLVVIAALIASTIECFLILPGHLGHGHGRPRRKPNRLRAAFDTGFQWFRDRLFFPVAKVAYVWRYATVAAMIAALMLSIGLLAGGRLKFVFFPTLPSENISAAISFAPGTPRERQIEAVNQIEAAMFEAERTLLAKANAAATNAGSGTTRPTCTSLRPMRKLPSAITR